MRLKIIGSGGCVSTPKPLCHCKVCVEAREKGFPYARCGCSLYVEDLHMLIDTPEDIAYALNHMDIKQIDSILYSHMDPDHTMGMRVIEQLRLNWLAESVGRKCEHPITVASLPQVMENIKCQGTKYGSALGYYESRNLIECTHFYEKCFGDIHLTLVPVDETENVTTFVFEKKHHKVIYAPCDVKPFPKNEIFNHADYLIIGNTIIGDVLKGGFVLQKDNPLRKELFTMDEIMAIKEEYGVNKVIMTHLEEDWGKSYEDYLELQKQYDGVEFAYDGLTVEV